MSAAERFLALARAALSGQPAASAAPGPAAPSAPVPVAAPVVTSRPTTPPAPVVLASFPSAAAVLGERVLSRGAARLWEVLHDLAVDAGRARRYEQLPRQVTFHCPAVTVAGVLDYDPRHLRRLAGELEAAGLLDCGGHAQSLLSRVMYDGTLWSVLVTPGAEPPRIRADEWRFNWRPDFEADVAGKTGAAAEMSGLLNEKADKAEKYEAARRRAAIPGQNHPPLSSSDISASAALASVAGALSGLWHVHHKKRARAVGHLASQIAAALGEHDRRRYWCRVIWDALTAQNEMRGGLQVLAAQLLRLEADMREGAPWKNPGAVLAARLKAA